MENILDRFNDGNFEGDEFKIHRMIILIRVKRTEWSFKYNVEVAKMFLKKANNT